MGVVLTASKLRELLRYDPETGIFTRRVATTSHVKIGDVAGWIDKDGYIGISLLNRGWRAHRLAWLYMTGEWPEEDIDHRDLDHANNRWENLRKATRAQNLANMRKGKTNTSGLKGVSPIKSTGKWRSTMSAVNRQVHLGVYDCAAAAHFAYIVAAHKERGEFARTA